MIAENNSSKADLSSAATLARKLPSLLVTNACHLTNKIELLNDVINDTNVNIAFINETWFTKDNSSVMKSRMKDKFHALTAIRDF